MTSNRSYRTVAIAFAAALTLVAAVLADRSAPAHAFPATASFTAVDLAWGETGTGSATVHVDPGAVVSFAYPSGANSHNADFGATAPSSCAQTAGADVGAVPPLPALPSGPGWSGTCTFNTTGTYQFHCDLHSSMHGTILVGDVPDPPPATGGSGGGGGGTNTGGGSGGASDPLTDLKIARTQRGTKVKGSIPAVSQGADLSIDITAKSSALKTSATKPVRVGRLLKSNLASGDFHFSIKLSTKALTAIKKKGKLALSVTVKLTPSGDSVAKATKSVTLKKG